MALPQEVLAEALPQEEVLAVALPQEVLAAGESTKGWRWRRRRCWRVASPWMPASVRRLGQLGTAGGALAGALHAGGAGGGASAGGCFALALSSRAA